MLISKPFQKFQKRLTRRKFESQEHLHTVLKDGKPHNSYSFMIIAFLYMLSIRLVAVHIYFEEILHIHVRR
jgi:hypothetical protein